MMPATNGEAVSIRSEHTKVKSYEPAQSMQARKFGPASVRFAMDFIDRLTERDSSYDPELNYALALVTGWCYSDGQTLADKLKYYGLQFAKVDEISVINPAMTIVASAFFARSNNGRVGVLAFRGTEPTNAINWLTDTDVIFRPFGDGMVHRGFYANLEAIWEEISVKLDEAMTASGGNNGGQEMKPMECLYITGHSLGAAMAVLAAAKIFMNSRIELKRALRGVYTYGQPAVGDAGFSEQCMRWFGDRLYRHVFAYDVVARLPPASTGEFKQFGVVRTATSASDAWMTPKVMANQASWVASAVAVSGLSYVARRLPALARLMRGILNYSFEDHSPTGYIEASRSSLLKR